MKRFFILFFIILVALNYIQAQDLSHFKYTGASDSLPHLTIKEDHQFNNYTTHWLNDYQKWYRYGNLFKESISDVQKTLIQSKIDIAGDLGIPGLFLEPGFLDGLINAPYTALRNPSKEDMEKALRKEGNILLFVRPDSGLGSTLLDKIPDYFSKWRKLLGAYQYNSPDIIAIDAFYIEKGNRNIFVITTDDLASQTRMEQLIKQSKQVLKKYNLQKGYFGAQTLLKSVTSTAGFPLDIIGTGMNEGASWFIFNGYMGYRMKKNHELEAWLNQIELPVVTDLGTRTNLYGCRDYGGYQPQVMRDVYTKERFLKYAQKKGCYTFRPVYKPSDDPYPYDGYIARKGNKEFIDTSHVPFAIKTGKLQNNLLQSMVLFVPKEEHFTRKSMWKAIMDRRSVGIFAQGVMIGSGLYRQTLDLLLLDKVYLEKYFGDRINLRTKTIGDSLYIKIKNAFSQPVKGKLSIRLPSTLQMEGNRSRELDIPAHETREIRLKLNPDASAMGKTNPIGVKFNWEGRKKATITKLKLPPAISVYHLLYGVAPHVEYPVTIHNFTSKTSYPVEVEVMEKDDKQKTVFQASQTGRAKPGQYEELKFDLKVPAGKYRVKVSALGREFTSQLGVGGPDTDGSGAKAYPVDLNGDGTDEYVMENDSVKVTLLTTGARIIQYIIKRKEKNAFIQVWPNKPTDSVRANRKHTYYPFGGFEDFLGQPGMETFKNYSATIKKESGDYVQVEMTADFYGNTITKIFTLYGNSPLIGIQFKLNFITPSSNVIGPQPMLRFEDGRTQDIIVPTINGIQHYRPKTTKTVHYTGTTRGEYGKVLDLEKGWNAGYSGESNLSWVGAFPVEQPLFLHVWFNNPSSYSSRYTYSELQPWIPVFRQSNWYFSYYMWGMDDGWKKSLNALRKRGLITRKE